MEEMAKTLWMQLGAIGLLIVILCFALYNFWIYFQKLETSHSEERKQWMAEIKGQASKMLDVISGNTFILSELSTLIKREHGDKADKGDKQ
ncbi:MAG: hypothetical protein HQK78_03250 [Desulfobacterales bacterium]|nr:hypothetical protein [Desulfobacterales bacterium]